MALKNLLAILAILLLFPLTAPLTAQRSTDDIPSVPLPSGSTFKVMAWNLEHFTDEFDDPYVDFDLENVGAKDAMALDHTAIVIRRTNPDFIVFTEAEGEAAIQSFVNRYLGDMNYTTVTAVRGETWHQNIVFVSRVPIRRITTLKSADLPVVGTDMTQRRMNNRIVMADVQVTPEYRMFVIALHLKAGRTDRDMGIRFGQIDAVLELASDTLRAFPDANILVLGDMNFQPTEPEYERLTTGNPPFFSLFRDAGYPRTHPADGPSRHIDMILVNEHMRADYIPGTAAVAMPLPREKMMHASDHLPVIASFYTDAAK